MGKVLIVVDYQKDFVDGALGFPGAERLAPGIAAKVEQYLGEGCPVIFTLDTHEANYLETREGRHLPVPHCLKGSDGWRLYGPLARYMDERRDGVLMCPKYAFGAQNYGFLKEYNPTSIELVGLVTNLCVISNAVVLQTQYPQAEILVDSSLCDSYDRELHQKALDVMRGMQMQVF